MYIKTLLLACILFAAKANAQPWLHKLAEIQPGNTSSYPNYYYQYNGKLLFTATQSGIFPQLMQTDGTPGGTVLLNAAALSASNFCELNGKMYFLAWHNTTITDNELWVTDGTVAGTQLIFSGIDITEMIVFNNKLLFGAVDAGSTIGLWQSDGTAAGTTRIKNMGSSNQSVIDRFGIINNKAVFVLANLGSSGERWLWATDGTEAGTQKLSDIWVAHHSSVISQQDEGNNTGYAYAKYNGKLYFAATDMNGNNGCELWKTDGTIAGTQLVQDIYPGIDNSEPRNLTVCNNKLFFCTLTVGLGHASYSDNLWVLEGEAENITKINSDTLWIAHYGGQTNFVAYNNYLYFTSLHGLYKSDGTLAGTRKIADSMTTWLLTPHNNYLYFVGLYPYAGNYSQSIYRADENDNIIKVTPSVNITNYWLNSIGKLGQSLYLGGADARDSNIELWKLEDFPNSVAQVNAATTDIIYPNPAKNTFSIKTDDSKNTTISVSSLVGQILLQIDKAEDIDISALPAGTYMVKVLCDGKVSTAKLVKE